MSPHPNATVPRELPAGAHGFVGWGRELRARLKAPFGVMVVVQDFSGFFRSMTTVKSQASRGLATLRRLLAADLPTNLERVI